MKNYYQEIKLNPTMTIEQIKDALNKFEKYWKERVSSPDLAIKQAAEDNLKLLEEAREILLDESKKIEYDNQLKELYINKKYKGISNEKDEIKGKDIITEEQQEKIEQATKKSIEKVVKISKKSSSTIIDFIKNNTEKVIIGVLALGCAISLGGIIKNTNVDKDAINSLKKENKILADDIKEIENKNIELDKELSTLLANNKEIVTEVENIKDSQFTAVPGTKWVGMRNYDGVEKISRPITLDITNDEIIMTMGESLWDRYQNNEVPFEAKLSIATGHIDKETGFMKLNRLDFINPPEGTENYKNEYCNYNYECIVNGNKITGIIIDNSNKVLGNIALTKVD